MNSRMINYFVIEDEIPIRTTLVAQLKKQQSANVVGEAGEVNAAYSGIVETKPDALFMDIRLIGGDGFQILERLRKNNIPIPAVIVVTAHSDFEYAQKALNEFGDHVVRILLKPIFENWEEHYRECCDAVLAYHAIGKGNKPINSTEFFFKSDNETYRVVLDDILYAEVGGGGTIHLVLTGGRQLRLNETLSRFLADMPDDIKRVNRNNAVNIHKIDRVNLEDHIIYLKDVLRGIDIGDAYYPDIKALFR